MTIGLHLGLALSIYLFKLIMDKLTTHIQDEVPWCMLFTDDLVLTSRDGINENLRDSGRL